MDKVIDDKQLRTGSPNRSLEGLVEMVPISSDPNGAWFRQVVEEREGGLEVSRIGMLGRYRRMLESLNLKALLDAFNEPSKERGCPSRSTPRLGEREHSHDVPGASPNAGIRSDYEGWVITSRVFSA